jgi:hypothetical protein
MSHLKPAKGPNKGPILFGIDPAQEGQNCTIVAFRQDGKALILEDLDPGFAHIFNPQPFKGHLVGIQSLISLDEKGRMLYRGRRYGRDAWTWRPPHIIRIQGRQAKDFSDKRNGYPTEEINTEKGKMKVRAVCHGHKDGQACGGSFLYDSRYYLYCERCQEIRDTSASDLTANGWARNEGQGSTMDDHDYSMELELEKKWTGQGLQFVQNSPVKL